MVKLSLALVSVLLLSVILFTSTLGDAAPAPKAPVPTVPKAPKPPKKDKVPAFTSYSLSDLKGKAAVVSQYGCHELAIGEVGSVKYKSGPRANIVFYSDKKCKGKPTHQMTTDTVKQMGGPYKTQSVRVTK
ncbi:hypothetical protein BGW38_000008 [Lunasporangiospora selenospora]|uniref:Secreted protein n=1 Tax=Lunasporangiospora selenospora TaxID=979761 RepID=A0A9P6G467_9FUNG|nr:hypothetical protein BGW38_000008 [Lunasporangiospora selenospora]